MMDCYSINGNIYRTPMKINSIDEIYDSLKTNMDSIKTMPVEAIVLILNEYSKKLSKDKSMLKREGVPFLTFFFRKNNLEKIIQINFKDKKCLNEFVEMGNSKYLKAQSRGVVCHWIAGNIPTLACYSVFQALITRNSNIVRVPKESIETVLDLLEVLKDIQVQYKNQIYNASKLIENISIVHFDSNDCELNCEMSKTADVRILWGGEEAVKSLTALPKKTTCKDIVFGPKYSFVVFDKSALESQKLRGYVEKLVADICTFDQKACSSPQVVFLEKSSIDLKKFANLLAEAFEKLDKRYLNNVDNGTAVKIINKRCEYGLCLDKDFNCSKGLNYTILIDEEVKLEDPIGGRCIFLKKLDNIFEVEKLITPRIQTIGIASENKEKILEFGEKVTLKGADRVVTLGLMNVYDLPWDGILPLSELVRWCCLQI